MCDIQFAGTIEDFELHSTPSAASPRSWEPPDDCPGAAPLGGEGSSPAQLTPTQAALSVEMPVKPHREVGFE